MLFDAGKCVEPIDTRGTLNALLTFARVKSIRKDGKTEETGVCKVSEVPRAAIVKAKLGAALEDLSSMPI